MRSFNIEISCLILIIFFTSNTIAAQGKRNFHIYNAMMFHSMPDLKKDGLSNIYLIYEDSALVRDKSYPNDGNKRKLSLEKLKRMAQKKYQKDVPVCFDFESWLLVKPYIDSSIKKYLNVLSSFRRFNNQHKIGFYGVLPYWDQYLYESMIGNKRRLWYQEWDEFNNSLYKIAKSVDIAFPSCYTRSMNTNIWFKSTMQQIHKIKLLNPNIPIYVFIWPQYYSDDNAKINNQFISGDIWRYELETIYKYADGIVIWSPPFNLATNKNLYWDANADWWKSTLAFINKYKIKS